MYVPIKPSRSVYLPVRGLRYHVRIWGEDTAPKIFMVHGWWDVAASFQFIVDALQHRWQVIAPDWRGSGESQWSETGSYWFSDFLGDLDRLVEHFAPGEPLNLVAHSIGFNVSSFFAGVRPERVRRLVNMDCYGFRRIRPQDIRERYAKWLATLGGEAKPRRYASYDDFAARMVAGNPRLPRDRADFIVRHLARPAEEGGVVLRNDPWQKDPARLFLYLGLIRLEEAMETWKCITAPVLWLRAAQSETADMIGASPEALAERRSCFRQLKEVVVDDASHMVHQEQPEILAREIEAFLLAPEPAAGDGGTAIAGH